MSTTRLQEILICFGKQKQTDIATANTAGQMWQLRKLNAALANPKLNTENDAEEFGKGHEFATTVYKTSWDSPGNIEKYLSAEIAAWAMAFGLGKVVKSGTTPCGCRTSGSTRGARTIPSTPNLCSGLQIVQCRLHSSSDSEARSPSSVSVKTTVTDDNFCLSILNICTDFPSASYLTHTCGRVSMRRRFLRHPKRSSSTLSGMVLARNLPLIHRSARQASAWGKVSTSAKTFPRTRSSKVRCFSIS